MGGREGRARIIARDEKNYDRRTRGERIVNGARCIELCRLTVDETRIQITDNEYLTNESADSFENASRAPPTIPFHISHY